MKGNFPDITLFIYAFFLSSLEFFLLTYFNPHMNKIFLQLYCKKWVLGDQLKEMLN